MIEAKICLPQAGSPGAAVVRVASVSPDFVMPLIRPLRRRFAWMLGAALAATAPAQADIYACQRLRSELASLGGAATTQRALQTEIGRLQAYYRTLSCEGGKFLFFDTRPPQCGAVEQRIRALQAGYGADNGEVAAARRRQITAAMASACADVQPIEGEAGIAQTARGGARVICVKTCDGSFFPMNNLPDGRAGADELCQALCPGTEAVAYSMPYGDEALRSAATIKGNRAYAALPNAFKFRTGFAPSCSCKKEGQTWAQSLAKAESMLVRHKGDIFVTPMQAEALSRPKVRLTLVGRADRTAADLAAEVANRAAPGPALAEGRAWSDPPTVPTPAAAARTGSVAEEKPNIRVIAPNMIPVPGRAGTP